MNTGVRSILPRILPCWVPIVILLVTGLVGISLATGDAVAQESGRVTGVVKNGTTGEAMPDVTVTLSRFEQVAPESVDVETVTDESGRFEFAGLDTSDGFAYAASLRYQGVLYSSGMILLSREPAQDVEVTVYETTTDASAIEVQSRAIVVSAVDAASGVVTLTDLNIVANGSDRTYVGDDDGRTLRIHVPASAVEVTPRPGFDFTNAMIEDAIVYASAAVRPGVHNATLDYTVPYAGRSTEISLGSSYPVRSFQVLAPSNGSTDGISVTSPNHALTDAGTIDIDGNTYHAWIVGSSVAGEEITLVLGDLPATAAAHNELQTTTTLVIAVSALIVASGLTGAVVYKRGLYRQRPVVLAPAAAAPLEERRSILTAQLRELEERWQQGEIEPHDYQAERRGILLDLRRISRQFRGLGDDE